MQILFLAIQRKPDNHIKTQITKFINIYQDYRIDVGYKFITINLYPTS